MLTDLDSWTDQDIYRARFVLAGEMVNLKGLVIHLSKDKATRARSIELRRLAEKVESRLESILRPR